METVFLCTVLILLISLWYRRQTRKMRYFERIGIPGPPPNFIKGNLQEVEERGLGECHKIWIEKYGRIVGYYIGCQPFVLIADPDLLKLIQIKHFSEFSDRRIIVPGGTLPTITSSNSLAFNKGRKWVEIRSVLSPAFTSGKLKKMYTLIEDCLEEFLQVIQTSLESSDVVDMHDRFTNFTMDVISRTSFGIKTDVQHSKSNPFIGDCNMAMSYGLTNGFVRTLVYFPEISPVLRRLRNVYDYLRYLLGLPSSTGVLKACSDVIAFRRSNRGVKKCDLIQLMVDNKVSEEELGRNEEQDAHSEVIKPNNKVITSTGVKSSKWYTMTDEEIQSNAMLFLLAGHHTTSTCLTFTVSLLASHQDVQDKLRAEVNNIKDENRHFTYEDVMNLPYLDQVICESLRLYPPTISFITRESTAEFRYKDIVLPANTAIQAAVAVLNYDSEYWRDPMKFDPERFSPENRKNIGVYYQPFGVGRRNCIGMRLALLEMKLALVKLIHSYKILPNSSEQIKVDYKVSVTSPKGRVPLRLIAVS